MMQLDVLVDARMLRFSGIGTYLRALLVRMGKSGIGKCGMACLPEDCAWAEENGFLPVPWGYGPYSPSAALTARFALPEALVFWVPHFNVPFLAPRHGRTLCTIHDLFHLDLPELLPRSHRLYARQWIRHALHAADTLIAVSSATKARIHHHFPDLATPVRVIHNGLEDSFFLPGEEANPVTHNPFLLVVGNVKPHKNLVRAVQAFTLFRQTHPDTDLVIVGAREGMLNVDSRLDALLQAPGVRFAGRVSDAALRSYYARCQCFLLPSLYEGFGLPVLEAMACGARVCASAIPSVLEIAAGHVTTFAPQDPNDMVRALEECLRRPIPDPEETRSWLSSYSWDHSWKAHRNVLEGLLA